MTLSTQAALRGLSKQRQQYLILLHQVRRYRPARVAAATTCHTQSTWRNRVEWSSQAPQELGRHVPTRYFHAEATAAAAAGVKAAKFGAANANLRSMGLALASGLAVASGLWSQQQQPETMPQLEREPDETVHTMQARDTLSSRKEHMRNNNHKQEANTTMNATAASSLATSPSAAVAAASSSSGSSSATSITVNCEPRRTTTKPRNAMLSSRKSMRGRGLYDKYKVDWDTVLGEGAYGSVHPARLAATGEKVALKRISKRYTNTSSFQTETDALFRIFDNGGHPNISGLRDMYDDHNYYYLILDLVTGGEMLDHLIENGAYSEADAARLMHEIASALAFLHGVGVIHADLKPENLLLSTKNRLDGSIKVIDFGCAVLEDVEIPTSDPSKDFMGVNQKNANSTGTTAYWPPERFEAGSFATPEMDMWSVGVILYIMLTGCHPYDINGVSSDEETEQQIRECKGPPMDPQIVGHMSESAKDLIQRLMSVDPATRISAYDMLHHPWVRGETATTEKIQDSDKKLSRFRDLRNNLEAGMFAVLVGQAHAESRMSEAKVTRKVSLQDDRSVHILKRAFDIFDAEGKGFVNVTDLGRVTREKTGSAVDTGEMEEILVMQGEGNGSKKSASSISLSQFSKLFSGLKHKHFPRGHYIFHAGDKGEAMYFLSSGKIEIQTRKGQLVSILRSGDFFGEGSLLEKDSKRFTSAKCTTPVDVIEISREDFERYTGASADARRDVAVKWRARSLQYAKNLLRLQKNVQVRELKKGQVVYKEGEIGKSMFRVDDVNGGELNVSHGDNVVHKHNAGDSFGESSLLFSRPRSSTVTCASDTCRLYEMKGEDFLAVVETNPEMAQSLRDMSLKRLLKRAVKQYSLQRKRGFSNDDLVAAFHDADVDKTGSLSLEELRVLMHKMDKNFPMELIQALLKHLDVDNDGQIALPEFKRVFRQFEDEVEGQKQKEKNLQQ